MVEGAGVYRQVCLCLRVFALRRDLWSRVLTLRRGLWARVVHLEEADILADHDLEGAEHMVLLHGGLGCRVCVGCEV